MAEQLEISEVIRRLQVIAEEPDEGTRKVMVQALCKTDAPVTITRSIERLSMYGLKY